MKPPQAIIYITILIYLLVAGCYPKPKLYEGETHQHDHPADADHAGSGNTGDGHMHTGSHMVTVEEVLDTEKYSYLYVSENGEKFWIAIPRKEIIVGGTYHYEGGLLKKNFESKEYDRVFETIYLVSDIHSHSAGSAPSDISSNSGVENDEPDVVQIDPAEGSITLSDLFANKARYQSKVVQVTGKCVKVNPMIMGRNWVHIRDGSGEGLDLTVTTTEQVKVGDVVSFQGTIALNKDFGAGYQYDIIMEQATLR